MSPELDPIDEMLDELLERAELGPRERRQHLIAEAIVENLRPLRRWRPAREPARSRSQAGRVRRAREPRGRLSAGHGPPVGFR